MRTPLNTNAKYEQGYILIELAIVMVVVGALIAASLPFYNTYTLREAPRNTHERMLVLENALSNYIQTRFSIPCPASALPADTAAGDNFGVARATCNGAATNAHGIIPYRTLGIPEVYAKDGYGNFFTYVVSPDFATINNFTAGPDNVNRRLLHHFADASGSDDLIDINHALYPRSLFCAPIISSGTDIQIDQDGVTLPLAVRETSSLPVGDSIIDANLNREADVTAIALAIISHGRNGYGSYQPDGSQKAFAATTPATAAERVTALNTNRIIETRSIVDNIGTDEYDDIVKFYTQEEIYGIAGGSSCEHL